MDLDIELQASYNFLENVMYLPSYILDGWVFNDQRPLILNIPTISYILGHEIFHGFDSRGHKYDLEGLF